MEIGERIRKARIKKGLSQAELGEKLGVQRSAVSKWEKGQVVNIKRTTLLKLSKYLEIPPTELIDSEGSMIDSTQDTLEEEIVQQSEPPKGYRIVSEDELDDIWKKIVEMSSILNANRKKKLMEYALELLKEQREEIDQMIELAKMIEK